MNAIDSVLMPGETRMHLAKVAIASEVERRLAAKQREVDFSNRQAANKAKREARRQARPARRPTE
jgi:hypothetical protein